MSESRQCQSSAKEMVCIDTYRILDSCRDKDCFEDVRVFLTGYGQELIERKAAVRAKCARIVWSYIDIDPVPFNRGFYQLNIKIYVRITADAGRLAGGLALAAAALDSRFLQIGLI